MIFQTYGDKNNKAVLLIHTLFTSVDFFAPIIEFLKKEYYVILPTLSGHHKNSLFISTADEIQQIEEFLKDNKIASLYAVAGFSLGGNIAYEFFCNHFEMVEKAIIDSAPLFKFPAFIKNYFHRRYTKCLKKIKSGNCDVPKELNKCFNGMGEYQKNIAPTVSFESLNNLIEACYNTNIHALPQIALNKIICIYGTKDAARLCKSRIKKYHLYRMKGYGHCGFYRENPI
ncbi:MAG: alpha/beta hydrolase, partial [Anaeroplasmataceae bacterium]|nr:alpha/beta hydrolase [Anaeroplasmataceae bacterium]